MRRGLREKEETLVDRLKRSERRNKDERTEEIEGERKITERRDPALCRFGFAAHRGRTSIDSTGMRMDHQSPDNLYLLGILTMTKGPDRRARAAHQQAATPLPATHKTPYVSPRAQSSRAPAIYSSTASSQ